MKSSKKMAFVDRNWKRELIGFGPQDLYLLANPTVTFFRFRYNKLMLEQLKQGTDKENSQHFPTMGKQPFECFLFLLHLKQKLNDENDYFVKWLKDAILYQVKTTVNYLLNSHIFSILELNDLITTILNKWQSEENKMTQDFFAETIATLVSFGASINLQMVKDYQLLLLNKHIDENYAFIFLD